MKEAFYFPHFIGARNDRKIQKVRRDYGIEGYAMFFMLLEVLREEQELAYPIEDIDILAIDFGTSEAKLKTLVLNYGLFEIKETVDGKMFFSPKQIQYLEPYFTRREISRLNGKKSGEIRRKKAEQLVLELSDIDSNKQVFNNGSTSVELRKKERKKETKEEIKENPNPIIHENEKQEQGSFENPKVKLNLSPKAAEFRQKLLASGYVGRCAEVLVEGAREDVFINERGRIYTKTRSDKQLLSSTLNEIWEQLHEINSGRDKASPKALQNLQIKRA